MIQTCSYHSVINCKSQYSDVRKWIHHNLFVQVYRFRIFKHIFSPAQGRNDGGHNFPGAEWLRGRRKVPTMSQVLSSIQQIWFRKISGSNMGGTKLASCPGRHLTSLRPWSYEYKILASIKLTSKSWHWKIVEKHKLLLGTNLVRAELISPIKDNLLSL